MDGVDLFAYVCAEVLEGKVDCKGACDVKVLAVRAALESAVAARATNEATSVYYTRDLLEASHSSMLVLSYDTPDSRRMTGSNMISCVLG